MPRVDRTYLICLVPVAILAFCWLNRSFPDKLSANSSYIGNLSGPQKVNISLALKKTDQIILKPQERFSFNSRIGARTIEAGFLEAPTYANGKTIQTEGGGVCLVSSLLYKSALEAGLKVLERHAHSRPVRSIKPGFDATVLFDRYDLVFVNNSSCPIKIRAIVNKQNAQIEFLGKKDKSTIELVSDHRRSSDNKLAVVVYKNVNGKLTQISRDLYKRR